MIAPAGVIDAARKVHDFLTVGAAAPLQEAAVTALNFRDEYYTQLRDLYAQKKDLFLKGLEEIGLPFTVPQGAYYVMTDVSGFGVKDDLQFCEWMAQEVGVAAVPGSSFFREEIRSFVRFNFAKKEETLRDALGRLDTLKIKAKGKSF